MISVFACLLQSQNSSFPEVPLGWAAYHHLSSGASGKFHCCQNPTFCIHVVLDQDERLILRIYHIKWNIHFYLIKSDCEFILLGPLCKKILEWISSRTGKHCSTSSKSNHSTQCQLSTMTMSMASSFSSLILSWINLYFHVVKRPIQDNTRYRGKIRVSNVLDKQALCLLVQVQPLYNTFHLCICKALMMGSLVYPAIHWGWK